MWGSQGGLWKSGFERLALKGSRLLGLCGLLWGQENACALDWLTVRGNLLIGYSHIENRQYIEDWQPPADGLMLEGRPWLAVPFGAILVGFGSQYRFFFTTEGRLRGQNLLEHQEFRPVFALIAYELPRVLRLEIDLFSWGILRSSGPWSSEQTVEHRGLQGIRLTLSRLRVLLEESPLEVGFFAEVFRYTERWDLSRYQATLVRPLLGISAGLEWGFEF